MQVVRCEDAREFLARTLPLRASDPIRTNVIGSVATQCLEFPDRYEACWWWLVLDGARPVGLAMRTAPFPLALGPMPSAAARALASAVLASDPVAPGVTGFIEPVEAFLSASEALGGRGADAVVHTQHQLVYECESVTVPRVDGELATATEADVELVDAWFAAFHDEVGHQRATPVVRSDADREAARRAVAEGRVTLWLEGGSPVSLAGRAVPVDTPAGVVERIGPVYTPPELRRRGYAGAVTGSLTRRVLDEGSRAMLFTDAANPTSNHVYQELGYELVDEYVAHELAPAG